eukprot:scaffold2684_cov124-Isochrysis_galbana.AAC.12
MHYTAHSRSRRDVAGGVVGSERAATVVLGLECPSRPAGVGQPALVLWCLRFKVLYLQTPPPPPPHKSLLLCPGCGHASCE